MLTVVNLVDNSEFKVSHRDLGALKLSNIWLKVVDPSEDELKALSKKIDASVNLIKPIEIPTFSAIHLSDSLAILYLSAIKGEFFLKDISKIAVVLGKGFMVTVSMQDVPEYENVKKHLHKKKTDREITIFDNLVYGVISGYMSYLEMIEEKLHYFESIVAKTVIGKEVEVMLAEIFDLKARLSTFARLMWYERSVINSLKRSGLPFLDKQSQVYLEEMITEFTKHTETVHNQLTRLSDVVYEYETKTSRMLNIRIERLTEVMKKLTAITVILTIPLMISGHFGMNFRFMPELDVPLAYPATIVISVLAIITAALIFWKKGWI